MKQSIIKSRKRLFFLRNLKIFTRGDSSRSEEGHGLGLAIVKSYVELCNGTFEIVIDGDMFKTYIIFDICE